MNAKMQAIQAEIVVDIMKSYFGNDKRRIDHAIRVLEYAKEIHKVEGGDPFVVEASAALHDIGIHEAERKYNSSAGNYQEIEGPPLAKEILESLDIDNEEIEHICKIIANHHSDKDIDTIEFKIIWDADALVNIPDEYNMQGDRERLATLIDKVFKTKTGKSIAINTLLI